MILVLINEWSVPYNTGIILFRTHDSVADRAFAFCLLLLPVESEPPSAHGPSLLSASLTHSNSRVRAAAQRERKVREVGDSHET